MAKWFINAPGRKRRRKKVKSSARRRRRTPPRGRGGRFISRKRKVRATVARKRRSRKRSSARRSTARRSTRRSQARVVRLKRGVVYANPRRRRRSRRRSYRRNPGFVSTLTRGLTDALMVTGGKVANNLVAKNLPFNLPLPGVAGDVVKALGIATLVSWGAGKFLGGDRARLVSAGAFQSVVEGLIKGLNVPLVSAALGEYDIMANGYNGLGAYAAPRIAPVTTTGMGAYPTTEFEGDQYAYPGN